MRDDSLKIPSIKNHIAHRSLKVYKLSLNISFPMEKMVRDFTLETRLLHSIQFTLDFCHMAPNKGDLRG